MTKQENIEEIVACALLDAFVAGIAYSAEGKPAGGMPYWRIEAKSPIKKLADLGVVIKVDRELPENPYEDNPYDEYANTRKYEMVDMKREGFERCLYRIKAGYEAVIPIKEGNDDQASRDTESNRPLHR